MQIVANAAAYAESAGIGTGTEAVPGKPSGLDGYGADGRVRLRWDEAGTPEERSVIIGYDIKRKLGGESAFKRINDAPIAIPYSIDDSGLYFEQAVFFQDEVENGRAAQYRVCARDIFGRAGEYSDVLTINENSPLKAVEKLAPPSAPSISAPVLSTDAPDYGQPAILADIMYEYQADGAFKHNEAKAPVYKTAVINGARQAVLTGFTSPQPSLVFFDADIKEGYAYKYWVSAWDEPIWNNESAWSQPTSCLAGAPGWTGRYTAEAADSKDM